MIYGELEHPCHPNHKLKLDWTQTPYTCDGCMEVGFGSRYRCNTCNYDLHKECAAVSDSRVAHSFFKKCVFKFLELGGKHRYCDACARDIRGFVYHCYHCGRDLHPCCVSLPRLILIRESEMKLLLRDRVSSKCHKCERKKLAKGQTWSYVSTCGKFHFHVSCVKDLLIESWEKACLLHSEGIEENSLALDSINPSLQLAIHNRRTREGSRFGTYVRMAKVILKFIISAVVGDPTAVIGGLITSLISSS